MMTQPTIVNTDKTTRLELCNNLDSIILCIGRVVCWANAALLLMITFQVVLRYVFRINFVALEELQWHLYALAVMVGVSYVQSEDKHVRVDIFRIGYSPRTKAIVEIIGILFLLLPFIVIIFIHSLDFLSDAWRVNESSNAPMGLPWRWVIKSVIPISFALLGLSTIARLIREITVLRALKERS